jgi:hypothetical protein
MNIPPFACARLPLILFGSGRLAERPDIDWGYGTRT